MITLSGGEPISSRSGDAPAAVTHGGGVSRLAPPRAGWEALFWLVFKRSANAIVLLDEQQRLLEVNDAAVALIGRARGELLGISLAGSFPPSERGAAANAWHRMLRAGGGAGTRVIVRPDGIRTEVDFSAHLGRIGDRPVMVAVMLSGRPVPIADDASALAAGLTRREREVVTLIALGENTREIAAGLHISPETVKSHVGHSMTKLRARTRAQLVAIALTAGHIAPVAELER
jgi:PAS domain S-box-containing protein